MVTKSVQHYVTVWTRDYQQTRFAWSCSCGRRWAPLGCSDPHPNDLPSKDAASTAGRAHLAVKAA